MTADFPFSPDVLGFKVLGDPPPSVPVRIVLVLMSAMVGS
jgi:hypothetical protein